MLTDKSWCCHRVPNGGILFWCDLKEDYCDLDARVYCIDFHIDSQKTLENGQE